MNRHTIAILSLLAFAALLVIGCAATQRPPSAFEQRFFDVTTNRTESVVATPRVITVTNAIDGGIITETNWVNVTNLVESYVLIPNQNAAAAAETGGAIINLAAPGFGALATSIVGGLFGLWGTFRSRQSNKTAASLAQIIETGEQVLLTMPNGPAIAQQWKAWMIKHQAEVGTIGQASQLVANIVDTEDARKAAEQIVKLLNTPTKA